MSIKDHTHPLQPVFGEQEFGSGCEYSHAGYTDCYIILAMFDHDYMGWHALVQHWDYISNGSQANCWNYGLVLTCRENDWETWLVHDFEKRRPSFSEATYYVDQYLECPEYLRFMLR